MSPGNEENGHVSGFLCEVVRLGVATDVERARVDRHLAGCASCRALDASLARAAAEFHAEVLPRTRRRVRAGIAAARLRRRTWRRSFLVLVPALAALLLWVRGRDPGDPHLGVKGDVSFLIAARRGERVFRPGPQDPVRPGDQIRFVIENAALPFVLIASIDGAGKANVYVPYAGQASVPLGAGPRVEIEGSIVLDASPGPERIFALFSAAPVGFEMVRAELLRIGAGGPEAIRGNDRLPLEIGEQASVLLEKVPH